jgi:hypothetical protein
MATQLIIVLGGEEITPLTDLCTINYLNTP